MTRRARARKEKRWRHAAAGDERGAARTPEAGDRPGVVRRHARAWRGRLGLAASAARRLASTRRPRIPKRSPQYWFALITLLIGALGVPAAWYGALRSAPSAAGLDFDSGIIEGSRSGGARSFATPRVHTKLRIPLSLTPVHQDLDRVAIAIAPSPSIELTGCSYQVRDSRRRRRCVEADGEMRIDVGHLGSGQSLRITAVARVVRRIEARESVVTQVSSAETEAPSRRLLDLYSPKGTRGEEEAREYVEEEGRGGPVHWQEPPMPTREDTLEVLGDEWTFLDPRRPHGLREVPYGRRIDVRSLIRNRFLGAKLVTFRSVVRSAPVVVQSLRVAGSGVRAVRETFAVGPRPRERRLWCATTRSTAQPPLRHGDPVLVRAALVGWGLARPDGRPVQAALMICPAVRRLDSEGREAWGTTAGGTSAPER